MYINYPKQVMVATSTYAIEIELTKLTDNLRPFLDNNVEKILTTTEDGGQTIVDNTLNIVAKLLRNIDGKGNIEKLGKKVIKGAEKMTHQLLQTTGEAVLNTTDVTGHLAESLAKTLNAKK